MQSADLARDEALIRQLLARGAQAIRDKDAYAVASVYAEDATCFELAPPLCSSAPETRAPGGIQTWFDTWRGPIGLETRDLRIEPGREVAFAYALERMNGRKRDGAEVDLWYRATYCLRKRSGTWKLAHAHHSVPFYMDGSARAALDLQP